MKKKEINIKALADKFWQQGYIHVESFFDDFVTDAFHQKSLDHFGMNPTWKHTDEFVERSNCEIVPWFPIRVGVSEFELIDNHILFNALTTTILGEEWANLYCMVMFSKEGTVGQAWHQDSPPENPSQFNLNRLLYTHDITSEIGGQVVVKPQTHHQLIPVGPPHEDIEGQVVLYPKKGDIVFLHGHCWHRVLPIKGAYRLSINYRAVPKDTPDTITDTAVYRNVRYHFPTESITEERD